MIVVACAEYIHILYIRMKCTGKKALYSTENKNMRKNLYADLVICNNTTKFIRQICIKFCYVIMVNSLTICDRNVKIFLNVDD